MREEEEEEGKEGCRGIYRDGDLCAMVLMGGETGERGGRG